MAKSFDVLIVGAGIVGVSCALELSMAGLTVGIVERDIVGSGATAAGMGHIVVMDDSEAQLMLTRFSRTLWHHLVQQGQDQHEWMRCGTIWVAADDEEMQAVHDKHALYHAHNIACEVLDAGQLYDCEPNLRPGLFGGLLVPDDGVVYAPRSAMTLFKHAEQFGATLLHGNAVRLVVDGVQLEDGQVLKGDILIVANGACARELLPELPIRPRKGHLAITDRYPGFVRHQLIELGYVKNAHAASGSSVAFNIQPRATGQVLIGSSRQFDEQSGEIDHPILSRMLTRTLAYMPDLAQCNCIRIWTGFRAATPDGLPLIGPHPELPGIWLATGHEGLGITNAPATAHLLAAQLLKREPALPFQPYLPERAFQEVQHG